MKIGDRYTESRKIIDKDIMAFVELTGDNNPVHLDDEAAKKLGFKGRIAHGLLSTSYISAIIATKFPGPGSIYLGQTFKFQAPVYLNEELIYELEVTAIKDGKPIYTLNTVIKNTDGEVKVTGEAVIRVPRSL